MKKLLGKTLAGVLGIAAACSLGACSEEQTVLLPQESHLETSALRTKDEALAIAESLNAARSAQSRAEGKRLKEVSVVGRANSRTASDTLIYAVNYEDNAGFVLVSAARHGIDVIGYADEGNFDAESASENSNFSYYLDAAKDYVEKQKISVWDSSAIRPSDYTKLIYPIVPRIKVQWGKRYPEGLCFSNYDAGCGQTAMAQMLSYLETPASIVLTYPGHDIARQTLDWNELRKHKVSCGNSSFSIGSHNEECPASKEVHNAIARLCRELAELNEAEEFYFGTGTDPNKILATFKTLCPGNETTSYKYMNLNYDNLWDDLFKKQGVALVSGIDEVASIMHIWVCDGGEMIKITDTGIGGKPIVTKDIYYHFNWGFYGQSDGYFAAGVFNDSKPSARGDYSKNPQYFVVYK